MKLTEIRIGAAKTINLGNYESIRVEAGLTITLQDGDDPDKIVLEAQERLKAMLRTTYKHQLSFQRGSSDD